MRTTSMSRRLVAAVLASLLVGLGAAVIILRVSGLADAVTFRYALSKGERRTYELSLDMKALPGSSARARPFTGSIRGTLELVVVDTTQSGSTIDLALNDVTTNPGSTDTPSPGGRMRLVVAPDGRVVNAQGGGIFGPATSPAIPSLNPTDGAQSQFLFPQYPAQSVRPHDTWAQTATLPLPFGKWSTSVRSNGRHDGFAQTAYGRAAKIHSDTKFPLSDSFTMSDVAKTAAKLLGNAAASPPPGWSKTSFEMSGNTTMRGDSLVLPKTGEVVRLDGVATIAMRMHVVNPPSTPNFEGPPGSYVYNATMKMTFQRVDIPKP